MTVYNMVLGFILDVNLSCINRTMKNFGFDEELIAKNAINLNISMRLPVLPDNDLIAQYCKVIKDNYKNDNIEVHNVRFDGFKKIEAVEI